jgi:indole-3-glycerol phosphate synthase
MSVLADIIAYKKEEVRAAKAATPLPVLQERARAHRPRGFEAALREHSAHGFALIAEIKKASPSKGLIRADFDPPSLARAYEAGGAACLSVLTDGPSFMGAPDHLIAARAAVSLPVLRKDFVVDPYQVAEAAAWGADAILIILASSDDALARDLVAAAREFRLDVLFETHDEAEMARAGALGASLVGVNNRDLKSFRTDLAVTERLAPLAPDGAVLIAESGIGAHADLVRLSRCGARTFLVGESLMRQPNVADAARALLSPVKDF